MRNKNVPKSLGTRVWTITKRAVLVLLVLFIALEVSLRFVLGNLDVAPMTVHPSDGRCVGLEPNGHVVYTGWWWKIPAVKEDANKYGYRGPARPQAKPPGTLRIALMGDSFVYGQGVLTNQTISAYLEPMLYKDTGRRWQVLNFGIPGLNLNEEDDQLRQFASRWHPDVVLEFLFSNDFEPPICAQLHHKLFFFALKHVYSLRFFLARSRKFVQMLDPDPLPAPPQVLFQEAFDRFKNEAEKIHARFGVVVIADPMYYFARKTGHRRRLSLKEVAQLHAKFPAWMSQTHLPWLDGRTWWGPHGTLPQIPGEGHFTAAGDRMIAQTVARWLLSSGLLNAPPVQAPSADKR